MRREQVARREPEEHRGPRGRQDGTDEPYTIADGPESLSHPHAKRIHPPPPGKRPSFGPGHAQFCDCAKELDEESAKLSFNILQWPDGAVHERPRRSGDAHGHRSDNEAGGREHGAVREEQGDIEHRRQRTDQCRLGGHVERAVDLCHRVHAAFEVADGEASKECGALIEESIPDAQLQPGDAS